MTGISNAVMSSMSFVIPLSTKKLSSIIISGEIKFEEVVDTLNLMKPVIDGLHYSPEFSQLLVAAGASSDLSECIHLELSQWTFGGKSFNQLSIDQLTILLSAIPTKFQHVKTANEDSDKSWQSMQDLQQWLSLRKVIEPYLGFFAKHKGPSDQDTPKPPPAGFGLA